MKKTILIVAGELSGDLHAAGLVQRLKTLCPDCRFFGLGGRNMKAAGVDISFDLTSLAVVGFVEVLKHYALFKKIFDGILHKAGEEKPDAAILVDYPGFNLRLAKELKKMGIPVVYFISPQVWAWGRERLAFIRETIGLMLVLFKFEETLYNDGTFNVKFVGHPLLDTVRPTMSREDLLDSVGFNKQAPTIALLPGSREKEVSNHLPVMLEAAGKIHRAKPGAQFLICRSSTVTRLTLKSIIEKTSIDFPYKILDNETYNGVAASDMAIVASGTATLETAILSKPMVIIYKVTLATWLLAKLFVKIPDIGLVNVVAGKRIVPELVQFDATPGKIARTALEILNDPSKREKISVELSNLKNTLGSCGAYERAAEEISKFLQ